jgi:hypothetical protein
VLPSVNAKTVDDWRGDVLDHHLEKAVPPSDEGGTLADVDVSIEKVPRGTEVGLWFLADNPHWATFECGGCGAVSSFKHWQLPVVLGEPCEYCDGVPTFLLGIVQAGGQVTIPTDADIDALVIRA